MRQNASGKKSNMASQEPEIRRRTCNEVDKAPEENAEMLDCVSGNPENVKGSEKNTNVKKLSESSDYYQETCAKNDEIDLDTKSHSLNGRKPNGVSQHSRQTAAEYADAVQQWMLQYHSWTMMNQYSNMMAFTCMNQQFGPSVAANPVTPIQSVQNGVPPHSRDVQPYHNNNLIAQPNLQHRDTADPGRGVEYRVAPIWKRVVAELIDFILLLLIKIGVACMLVDITGGLGHEFQPLDVESLVVDGEVDMERLLNMTSELMAIEVVNRIFISLFEAMCLRQGIHMIGGSTPGKRIMGLCVVSCQRSTDLANNRILIVPAQNIGLWSAMKRSFVKNFSMAFLFPMCVTALFFQNGQAAYDLLAQCIVVEDNARRPLLAQQ